MRTEDAFRQDIRDNPDDDAPRLIFADWLEEQGRRERAEFIRVQCELARLDEGDDRYWPLRVREQLLLWGHGKGWAAPLRHLVRGYTFRRGFVDRVSLSAAQFLERGEQLFQREPVTEARLTDGSGLIAALAASPLMGRLRGLDLRHTEGLTPTTLRPLLQSPNLRELRSLCLRGTGLCCGDGLIALAGCPSLDGLRHLDLTDLSSDVALSRRRRHRMQALPYEEVRTRREAAAIGKPAMMALVGSPYLGRLRSLALAGYAMDITPEAFDALFDSPLMEGLEELDLSNSWGRRQDGSFLPAPRSLAVIERLWQSSRAGGLRVLHAGKHFWRVGQPAGTEQHERRLRCLRLDDSFVSASGWQALFRGGFPHLTTLHLHGLVLWRRADEYMGGLLTSAHLPRLRTLDLHQTPLDGSLLRASLDSPLLRQLRWLSLANRSGHDSSSLGNEVVAEFVRSPAVDNLVHLDLSNHDLGDDAAHALASSPHLRQIASLNLWHNRIGDAGALALTRSDNLPSLVILDLRANPVNSSAARRLLRERFGPGVRYGPGPLLEADRQAIFIERYRREHPELPAVERGEDDIPF